MKRPVLFFRSPVVYGTKRNERNPRGNETVHKEKPLGMGILCAFPGFPIVNRRTKHAQPPSLLRELGVRSLPAVAGAFGLPAIVPRLRDEGGWLILQAQKYRSAL
jgi:hypothetical protein